AGALLSRSRTRIQAPGARGEAFPPKASSRSKIQVLPGEHVLPGRCEHVDDLGVLGEIGLVRRVPGDHAAIPRPARALLAVEIELHPSREHPEDLLVRMLMARGVRARLHSPEHDHAL